MSAVVVTDSHVEIHFTRGEKVGGLVRDQRIPRTAVTDATVVTDPVGATSGMRAPGLGIPRRRKVGTWRKVGHRMLVCVRAGEPALRLELEGQRYDSVLIGTDRAEDLARQLDVA